jgi:hypothetical protein
MLVTSEERFEVDDRVVGSVFRSSTAVLKKLLSIGYVRLKAKR